ncbi:MAG: type II secretion system protein M [Robiginitomaculum sp.]|nr:type II secretion system protein M [Robiginitomaculum sp.]
MIKYWTNLSIREKLLVSVAAGIIALFIVWQFAFKPLLAFPSQQKKMYEKAQTDLLIMREGQSVLVNSTPLTNEKTKVRDIFSEVTRSAVENGLVISRRQPNGATGISLWFAKVQSPKLYQWLDELTREHDIVIVRASVNKGEGNTVQAQITFELGS